MSQSTTISIDHNKLSVPTRANIAHTCSLVCTISCLLFDAKKLPVTDLYAQANNQRNLMQRSANIFNSSYFIAAMHRKNFRLIPVESAFKAAIEQEPGVIQMALDANIMLDQNNHCEFLIPDAFFINENSH